MTKATTAAAAAAAADSQATDTTTAGAAAADTPVVEVSAAMALHNAAPDTLTAAAAVAFKEDKAAGKSDTQREDEAAAERERVAAELAKVKPKHYKTTTGGVMIDPDTLKEFNSENAVKSVMTSWLDFQIKNGKITEDTDD